jgi:pimeloyl-ACP methyl ester carboxylesterase
LVWGERDRLVAPPKRLPPQVRSVVLPGAGHLLSLDRPREVAELILQTDHLPGS